MRAAGAAIGGGWFGAGCQERQEKRRLSRSGMLWEDEFLLLAMIAEQIIPADRDPGAREAGVADYIDRQLAPGGRIADALEDYRVGLAAVQQAARKMFAKPFQALAWGQQTELLKAIEGNRTDPAHWVRQPSAEFFQMVRRHTIEGYFGHPRHGGNRGLAGYRLLGIEFPELRGQNRYTDARFRDAGKGGRP